MKEHLWTIRTCRKDWITASNKQPTMWELQFNIWGPNHPPSPGSAPPQRHYIFLNCIHPGEIWDTEWEISTFALLGSRYWVQRCRSHWRFLFKYYCYMVQRFSIVCNLRPISFIIVRVIFPHYTLLLVQGRLPHLFFGLEMILCYCIRGDVS